MRPDIILETLENAGWEAYYVGGCVRDTLLGRPIHDWDITTSAEPETVLALFPDSIPTGLQHGTVTVRCAGVQAEVTTFRADGAYRDGRHPEAVTFVRSLEEDLARRDFTVNAMALDLRGELTDLFGGQEDLRARCIRAVGEPERRFREDALRMLRAWRFCAQLDFSMEAETRRAISVCAPLAAKLSRERVREETEKTLCSPRPRYLEPMLAERLLAACTQAPACDLSWLESLPAEPTVRWAGLLVLQPALELGQFRLPGRVQHPAQAAARVYRPARTRIEWKRLIAECGWETAQTAAALCGSDAVAQIRASGECVSLQTLAVSGGDFPELSGPAVGNALRELLDYVLNHPEENRKERLLAVFCERQKKLRTKTENLG